PPTPTPSPYTTLFRSARDPEGAGGCDATPNHTAGLRSSPEPTGPCTGIARRGPAASAAARNAGGSPAGRTAAGRSRAALALVPLDRKSTRLNSSHVKI